MGIIMQHGLVENRLNARGPLIDYEQPGGTAWGDAALLAETVSTQEVR